MTHTHKKKIDRRAAGIPTDGRTGLPDWETIRRTGKPGDRGVTQNGLVKTVPGKIEGQVPAQKER